MDIRTATPDDITQLAVLFDGYRVFYKKPTDIDSATNFLKARLENDDSVIYVCENEGGELLGFTQLYPLFSSTRMSKLWLLNDLYVSPNSRGLGVSKMLIERAKQLVRDSGACAMYLETGKSNTIGNQLYPATGFKLNETANFYDWTNDQS